MANEIIRSSYNNLQYFISGYSQIIQENFGENSTIHSPIIGWAYDGNPIYGCYGYSDPEDKNSEIKKLSSGYSLNINNISNRPSSFPPGFFIDDYKFENSGDLDECNGRFCVTPEFPNGVYAYFATSVFDDNGDAVGQFPYFIGNRYRSKFIDENKSLNQSFDFNNSDLVRNTFPYKISDLYANNDFIAESNEFTNQVSVVESVTSGVVENFEIINPGKDYKIGDQVEFDEDQTNGGGLTVKVSEIFGKDIVSIDSSTASYNNSVFTWENSDQIKVKIIPNHNLNDGDYVNISGFSSSLSKLNGFHKIGVSTYQSVLTKDIPSYSFPGIVTDIYLSYIPENISIGSSLKIDGEILQVLNIFASQNILRVNRETTGSAHTSTSKVDFIPDTFTFSKSIDFFESKNNDKVYFNPRNSLGIGTVSGVGIAVTYNVGIQTNNIISVPTQSIYIPNHPFKTNQEIVFRKSSGSSQIYVKDPITNSQFYIPTSGNFQNLYVIKKSQDYIGIVTQVGLTTISDGLFFIDNGSDSYDYSLESNFDSLLGNIDKISSTITVSEEHNLKSNDTINLSVKPNLTVGIGSLSSVKIKRSLDNNVILVNPLLFSSSNIDTTTNVFNINSHNLKTGDKVRYSANSPASGFENNSDYFVYKINENKIKLCETYIDSIQNVPNIISIGSTGGSSQSISLVNPKLDSIKNRNLRFDLSDSSLQGYDFKLFYDENFNNEFISTGSSDFFSVQKTGTIGVSSDASLIINYDDNLSNISLFYSLIKDGNLIQVDKEVLNYCQINFANSYYNGSYSISGIGSTTFSIFLKNYPEKNNYNQSECDELVYTTPSQNVSGGISKVKAISLGSGYKKIPIFKKVISENGSGAYIIPKSNSIGNVNEIKFVNEGFEYSSDKTLKPQASIAKFITLKNSSTISEVIVDDGGKNYISPPDLIIIDSETKEQISSGILRANISGNSINSVKIENEPKGLPESIVTIRAINNTNGVNISNVQSSASGIVTCFLVTPLTGFGSEPFKQGDRIFVEGIEKNEGYGDGLNSSDYGFEFFTVSNYVNAGTSLERKLEFNLSGFTTNPGIAKTILGVYGNIVNYDNYPKFTPIQLFSNFIVGEKVEVYSQLGFQQQDLRVVESDNNYIKISGTYDLSPEQVIRGVQSGTIATINDVKESKGQFVIDYSTPKNIGWSDNIGKLNEDTQVIEDNDYYQNLSYSVKSNKEWSEISSPVNSILHPSGLKNFSDTQILKSTEIGVTSSKEYNYSIYDIVDKNRVDTINNFDLSNDIDVVGNLARFIKFKNKKLTNYIESRTNRTLAIDDISSQFSTLDRNIETSSIITNISPSTKFNRYLVQISDSNYDKVQFNEIIVLNDDNDIFTLEKGYVSNFDSAETGYTSNLIGDISGFVDDTQNYYLKFEPREKYLTSYNIKYLNTTFSDFSTSLGVSTIGFVSLNGFSSQVSSGSTITLLSKNIEDINSIHSQVHIFDSLSNQMNYVEVFVDHDGVNSNLAEFYFDNIDGSINSNFIGEFSSSIDGGILTLKYENTSNNNVILRSRNVGFGTTSLGSNIFRFKQPGQIDGTENTAIYTSYQSIVSTASSILNIDNLKYKSVKSTLRVSIGETSALHQLMFIIDDNISNIVQFPYLSVGTNSGIGTFGVENNGSVTSLKFYPDQEFSGNFDIVSFNEVFFRENDYINVPPNLTYGNIRETVGVSKYFSPNDNEVNRTDFTLEYQGTPIFMKTFDPSDSLTLNLSSGEFNIPNHFFSTGEELIYRPNSTFVGVAASSVGIGSTQNYAGITTNILPEKVYAIKIDNNKFKLSTRKEYANAGIYVTFTSTGSGNSHQLEMMKKNEKCIITVDNVIQSPIAYSLLDYSVDNGGTVSVGSSFIGLSGISSIVIGDILKIDNEYMKVTNIGFGTTYSGPITFSGSIPLVNVERGFVGSSATTHSNSSNVSLYRGSFNIVNSDIHFTSPPQGSLEDQLFGDPDRLPEARSYFSGRVFLKQDYTSNTVYDNISQSFTGIGQTYNLTVSGLNTIGLGLSGGNGIVLINGIFQAPSTENNSENNFSIQQNTNVGITTIIFTGITSPNDESVITSDYDVNLNQLPRGGLIVSLGSSLGLGYAPLVGASVTAILDYPSPGIGSIIGVVPTQDVLGKNIGNWGSGYRSPVSIAITDSSGSGAIIQANVGAGGTLSFTIINGGVGYSTENTIINVSPPSYSSLPIVGVSRLSTGSTTECGKGLLLNVEVGSSSTTGIGSTLFEVTNFKVTRPGYGFRPGDVFKPVGLVTAYGLTQPISEFKLTVLDTFTDQFSAWQFGELDYIDSIKNLQDGTRTRFPLYYNSELLSFEVDQTNADSQLIDLSSNLVIFVNGILQNPGESYIFDGGTSFTFTQAPKPEDKVSIYFYRGSSSDSLQVDANANLKIGDEVQIFSNNNYLGITTTQDLRTITDIFGADKIETTQYTSQGIDEINLKPLYLTKQKVDKIINGTVVSKERDSIESQIYPTAKVIKNINQIDNQIFVDNSELFNYEEDVSIEFGGLIVSGKNDPVSGLVTAVVSSSGTIQSLVINNSGSGYIGTSIVVSVAPPSKIGAGIGTTCTASISILNGSLSTVSIINPGFGYTSSNPPQVLVPLPDPTYEKINSVTQVTGRYGSITGIGTTVGVGTNLALNFTLSNLSDLSIGYPIYIFNTKVGNGVTSIDGVDSNVVGIGTTFLDNIYYISGINSSLGIVTCNVHSQSQIIGINTSGSNLGNFSWGRLSGVNIRSESPISIQVSGFTVDSGLSTFPTIQRRDYGLRNNGSLIKKIL